ncbi:WD40 repeat-like protein, partial [Schizopora paradoxa]
ADDDACFIVWNIKTGEIVMKIDVPFNGAIGAAVWLTFDEGKMGFAFGCADGSIHIYWERKDSRNMFDFISMVDSPGPIECLSFDAAHRRLASVGGGCLQVWKLTETGSLVKFNEERVQKPVVAKFVKFIDEGSSVIVCYLESHEISCYTIEPWSLKWTKLVPTRIGHAYLCSADGTFLYVSNLLDGVDQYRFPNMEKVQSFTHPISVNLPLQVACAARGQWIVCGGDSGFARVFNRRTGQVLQILDHCES